MTVSLIDPTAIAGIDVSGPVWRLTRRDFEALLPGGHDLDALVANVASAVGAEQAAFELRAGDWHLDLPAAIARSLINATVLTGALALLHEASIPAAVLGVVVPLIFDVKRVKLGASDRYVYAVLREQAPHRRAIRGWYDQLPPHVRDEVTALEFRDIIERLEDAGLVGLDERDQLALAQPSDRRLVRLRLPPAR